MNQSHFSIEFERGKLLLGIPEAVIYIYDYWNDESRYWKVTIVEKKRILSCIEKKIIFTVTQSRNAK